jgi:hypothetical protein
MLTCKRNLLTVREFAYGQKEFADGQKKLLTVRKPCQLVWIDR